MIRNPYVKQLSSKGAPQIPHSLASGQKRTERHGDELNLVSTDAAKEDVTTVCTAKSNDIEGISQKGTPKTIHNNSNADRKILHPVSTFETIAPAELSQPVRTEDSVPNKPFPAATTSPFCSVPIYEVEPIDMESSSLVPLAQQHPPMRLQSQAVGNKSSISASLLTLPRPQQWNSKGAALSRPPGSPSSSVGTNDVDPHQLSLPRELQFTLDVTQPIQDEHRADLVRNAALSEPLCNGWTLYSHQKRAILVSLLMRRHILALDMGLGKTLIGCCWARAFYRTIPNIHIIVLCPVSLKEEWHRTSQDIAGLIVRSDEMNHKSKRKRTAHDSLDDDDSNSRGVVTIVSWAKIPSPDEVLWDRDQPYVVVADEAHSMQNMSSARTRDALRLMLAPNAKGVLLLTGTPMKNGRPANLFPLLKAVKHPFGNHQRAYEAHFCGGRDVCYGGRTVWMATGGANLDQLRCLTQSHMLHMTKDDCLKNLPKQSRVFKEVPVSSRAQMRHNEAMQKLAKAYENRQESSQEAILGAVQNLRLIDSFAKVDATVEIAKDVLIKEAAVVIFTSFVDVAKMLFQKLSDSGWHGELLTGETPAKKRQAMVDNFQNGLSAVFCCTFGAGGVGLTLTAASTVILLDRPWTPGDAHQAEDRVRRIGQTKPVTSIWMSAFELDKQIDMMLESKSQTSSTVLSAQNRNTTSANLGSNPDLMAHAPKLSILKLLQSILPSAKQSSSFDGLKQTSMLQYSQGSPRQKLKRVA